MNEPNECIHVQAGPAARVLQETATAVAATAMASLNLVLSLKVTSLPVSVGNLETKHLLQTCQHKDLHKIVPLTLFWSLLFQCSLLLLAIGTNQKVVSYSTWKHYSVTAVQTAN